MKTKTYQNTLLKDVEKVKLFAMVNNAPIETNLFGIYSPSVNKILINCRDKFIPTSNADFILGVEALQNEFNLTLDEVFSLSDGGKLCSWLSFNDVYNQFNVPTKLKRNKQKLNITANLYVVECNDTTSKMHVGVQLIINSNVAFLISDETTASNQRSRSEFNLRKGEFSVLIDNAIKRTNEFLETLDKLYALPNDVLIEADLLKQVFTKKENTSEKVMAMINEVESNTMINKNIVGDNYLALALALGDFLFNKYDLFINKNLDNYLFSSMKMKNDLILSKLKSIVK